MLATVTTENTKKDIRKLSLEEIQEFLVSEGEKPFRAKQIREWLWKKGAVDFDRMTNISFATRDLLKNNFTINPVRIYDAQTSSDLTIKSRFQLHDGHLIEGVLIPAESRMTACISSQVGCSLSCKFCATGYMERKRNVDAAEIFDQVALIDQQAKENYGHPLTNIVFMGMGEPLLNYKNMLDAIEMITSPQGMHMSPKRITISTAGIAKMIKKLGDDEVKFNLALSLHAANDRKRNEIMPINESNNLEVLRDALKYYFSKTKNQVTFEYIVFSNFNDTLQDAEELYRFTKHFPSKVNLIEYNPISEASFTNTGEDKLEKFAEYLKSKNVNTNLRRSRGKDIDAACGQLANKDKTQNQ